MTDREKVIKGPECCAQMPGEPCRKCPYSRECEEGTSYAFAGTAHLAADDLSLLKAQEPVQEIPDDDVFAFGLRASAMPMIKPIDKMSGEKIAFIMGTPLPTVTKAEGWISVKDRMPESGKHVLATCEIRPIGREHRRYVCDAFYAGHRAIGEHYVDDDSAYEYDEETDEYYLREGWYEVIKNWDDFGGVAIGDFVTHWMPLPEPPKEG